MKENSTHFDMSNVLICMIQIAAKENQTKHLYYYCIPSVFVVRFIVDIQIITTRTGKVNIPIDRYKCFPPYHLQNLQKK